MIRSVLALLLFTSVASADEPVQAIAPRRTSCKPNGSVWLEIAETDTAPKAMQTTTRLYGNGAVTVTRTRGASTTTENARCVSPAEMEDIEALLKKSSWKPVEIKRKVPCTSTATTATSIKAFDKPAVVERACNATGLDPMTARNLASVRVHLGTTKRKDCEENPLAKGCL